MPWDLRSHHGRADEAAERGGTAHGWRYAARKRVAGRVASRVELMPSALEELINRTVEDLLLILEGLLLIR